MVQKDFIHSNKQLCSNWRGKGETALSPRRLASGEADRQEQDFPAVDEEAEIKEEHPKTPIFFPLTPPYEN